MRQFRCHLIMGTALFLLVGASTADPETVPSAEHKTGFVSEHRSAKPEPFIDRLVSLFSGAASSDSTKKDKTGKLPPPPHRGPIYQHRPPPQITPGIKPYGPPPPRPVRNPRPPPPPPPQAGGPTRYQPQPSNNLPTFVSPGGSVFNSGGPPKPSFGGAPRPAAPIAPVTPNDPWQIGQPASMAQIKDLQVQCEKDMMRVRVLFDRPFYGMIFSKGHYRNANCVHVPANLGQTQATFDIALQSCGMTASGSQGYSQQTPQGSYIENTIIIQYDPQLQEVWDQARRLRCTWYDFYEKAVTFKPYQVDMLDPVTANFLGDNLRCWMQIQVGKGPQASEVSGIVKIGQTMTMVIGVKDDENKFDMMVRNCVAHDGSRAPIQLVDEKGCVPKERQKIMSPFKKVKNFDNTANVLSYGYFQAFKFPDSMNVHFQCVVQVCRGSCPDPQCGGTVVPPRSTAGGQAYSSPQSAPDSYGSPQGSPIGQSSPDSYGSPQGTPIGGGSSLPSYTNVLPNPAINPRLPTGGSTVYSSDDSFTAPGFTSFKKRTGSLDTASSDRVVLGGGRPRSLEDPSELEGDLNQTIDAKNTLDEVRNALEMAEGDDNGHIQRSQSRKRRFTVDLVDENGNRILSVHKREATEMADVETTEKVIQVIAPNDVQFHLPTAAERRSGADSAEGTDSQDSFSNFGSGEEVVINTNTSPAEAVCLDTTAFVCAAVTFIMIFVIALITIVFLWLRIKSLSNSVKAKTILQ